MKTQMNLPTAILGASLLLRSGCGNPKMEVNATVAVPVQTAAVEEVAVDTSTHYSAIVEPDTTVDLAFKVGGYIELLLRVGGRTVQEGDFVSKGAVLARVRQSDYGAALDASRARAQQAEEGLSAATWQLSHRPFRWISGFWVPLKHGWAEGRAPRTAWKGFSDWQKGIL